MVFVQLDGVFDTGEGEISSSAAIASYDFACADEDKLPPAELLLRRERASTVTKGFIRFRLVPPQSTSE